MDDDQHDLDFPPAVSDPAAPPADLEQVVRARDLLLAALTVTATPTLSQLEVLASLSEECRARAVGQPDALANLITARRREAERFERMCHELKRERQD